MTTGAISLHLSDDVRAVLAAWAEADGSTMAGKVEQIVRAAVQEARGRIERELVEARDVLEATASLLPLLLRKGPNEVLVPGDLPAEAGDGLSLLASEILASLGDAADLSRVQGALNDAAARYQRAAKALAAFGAIPGMVAPDDSPTAPAAVTAKMDAAPAPVWTLPPAAPAPLPVRVREPFDGDPEPMLIPDAAVGPALRGERLDPVVDPDGRGSRLGTPEFRDARKRPLRLFAKNGNGGGIPTL